MTGKPPAGPEHGRGFPRHVQYITFHDGASVYRVPIQGGGPARYNAQAPELASCPASGASSATRTEETVQDRIGSL